MPCTIIFIKICKKQRAFCLSTNTLFQVLVMTAQILLNILRHSIIKMDTIDLLVLDECHHAVKKHPYSLVMSEFYHTTPKEKRPAVFGMTASPVNLKGFFLSNIMLMIFFTNTYSLNLVKKLFFRSFKPRRLCHQDP